MKPLIEVVDEEERFNEAGMNLAMNMARNFSMVMGKTRNYDPVDVARIVKQELLIQLNQVMSMDDWKRYMAEEDLSL